MSQYRCSAGEHACKRKLWEDDSCNQDNRICFSNVQKHNKNTDAFPECQKDVGSAKISCTLLTQFCLF